MGMLRVTQQRSAIGCTKTQRATLKGLGLTRRMKTVELNDTPSIRGMVKKVIHLVEVQVVPGGGA